MSAKLFKLPPMRVNASFHPDGLFGAPDARDSWDLRSEFLALKADDEFVEFLRRTGDFDVKPQYLPGPRRGTHAANSVAALAAHLREWQKLIKVLSEAPRGRWSDECVKQGLAHSFDTGYGALTHGEKFEIATSHCPKIHLPDKERDPVGLVADTVLGAMLDSIYAEKMQGYETRYCAFEGCPDWWIATDGNERRREFCKRHASSGTTRRWRERNNKGLIRRKHKKRNKRKETVHARASATAA